MEPKLHPPKHCPNCGSSNVNVVVGKGKRGSAVYDLYCEDCEWSGDISPDLDFDYYRSSEQTPEEAEG